MLTYWFDIFNIVNKVGAEDLKLKMPIILVMSGIYLLMKNVGSVTPGYKKDYNVFMERC